MDDTNKINRLQNRLDDLIRKQFAFHTEIEQLQKELKQLKQNKAVNPVGKQQTTDKAKNPVPIIEQPTARIPEQNTLKTKQDAQTFKTVKPRKKAKSNLEEFIGENLINKIGVAIIIIGVGIGTKYAIENQLISPLTRIILGYLLGIGLLGFALKLKQTYSNFSAVLLSGAMAILYFITFAAYSFYQLIPIIPAFGFMVIFTAFTVAAAINYNKQVIALIGMVGAYAVPFLLSDGSGKIVVLFSYIGIINIGILSIAFKKYWKLLYYTSFGLTWLIYGIWYGIDYSTNKHFLIAILFLFAFFSIFYATFLAYKLVKKERFLTQDIVVLFLNSFIFYGLGYGILNNHETGQNYLGLFTVFNAMIHFIVGLVIHKQKLADTYLLHTVLGLVLVFITIAIPVQLEDNWVTLLWVGEAALLFWIGRTKQMSFYEKLSYPLMLIAFFSLIHDWSAYANYHMSIEFLKITPIFNVLFLSSLLFLTAFGFINYLNSNKKYASALASTKLLDQFSSIFMASIFILSGYFTFWLEIENYWNMAFYNSKINILIDGIETSYSNHNLNYLKTIWQINYTLLFTSVLAWINHKLIKNYILNSVSIVLLVLAIFTFLTQGLLVLSKLRDYYLEQTLSEYFKTNQFNITIRYITYVFVSLALVVCNYVVKATIKLKKLYVLFGVVFHITLIWILSSELINLMDLTASTQSYKLGLSLLWGSYAFLLIAVGIWKNKKHLRIFAFGLFGITLVKLFFYDIAHLSTLSKTLVMVPLGVLLLIISFLYNKYKHIISDGNKN